MKKLYILAILSVPTVVNDRKEVPIVPGAPSLRVVAQIAGSIALCATGAGVGAAMALNAAFSTMDVASGAISIEQALVQTAVATASSAVGGYGGQFINMGASGIDYKADGGIGWDADNVRSGFKKGIYTMALNAGMNSAFSAGGIKVEETLWAQAVTSTASTTFSSAFNGRGKLWDISFDNKNWMQHITAGVAAGSTTLAMGLLNDNSGTDSSNSQIDGNTDKNTNNTYDTGKGSGSWLRNPFANKAISSALNQGIMNLGYAVSGGKGFRNDYVNGFNWNALTYNHVDIGSYYGSKFNAFVNDKVNEGRSDPNSPMERKNQQKGLLELWLGGIWESRKGGSLGKDSLDDEEEFVDNAGVLGGEPPRHNPQEKYAQENTNVNDVASSLAASDKSLSPKEAIEKVCSAFGVSNSSEFKEQIKDMPIEDIQKAMSSLTSGMSDAQKAKFAHNLNLGMGMRSGNIIRQGTVWIDKASGKKVANVRSDVLQKEYQEKVQNEYGSTSSMMYGQVISQQYGVPADIEKLTNWKYTTEQISFGMTPQGATADALAGIRYDQYSNVVTGDYLRAVNQIHNQERKEYWQGFGHGTMHQLTDIAAGTLKGLTALVGSQNMIEQQRMLGIDTFATRSYDSIMGHIDDRLVENYSFFNADIHTDSYLDGRSDGRTAVKVAEVATMMYGTIRAGVAGAARLPSASSATSYWKTVLSKEGVFNGSLNAALNIGATGVLSKGNANAGDYLQAGLFGFVGGAALYPFSGTNLGYKIAERGLYSGLVGGSINAVNQGVNTLRGQQDEFDYLMALSSGGLGVIGTYGAYGLTLKHYNKNLLNWMNKGYTLNESVRMQREWWKWSKNISVWTKYAKTDGAATTIGGGVGLGLTWTYDKFKE